MCSLGRGQKMPEPLTKEEMIKATDNPFENPDSGVTAPSWKTDTKTKTNKNKLTASDNYQG
tara:strand:+ start:355 stop:537 length:183 start_codon:yes stop_codon:yes gene_type:complete